MRTYQALSYGEKWRVTRLVAKGEAPDVQKMAAAAVELAERCQRKGRNEATLFRFLAIALILVGVTLAIVAAADGDALVTSAMALIALTNVGQLISTRCFGQRTWPDPWKRRGWFRSRETDASPLSSSTGAS